MRRITARRLLKDKNPQPVCHYCGCKLRWGLPGEILASKEQQRRGLATLDHIVPQSAGGTWSVLNLVIACRSCNYVRGNQPYEEFKKCLQILEGRCNG